MMIRCLFCSLAAAICAGCGGGDSPAGIVEFYGDSLTFGSIAGDAGQVARIPVPPVRRAQEALSGLAVCVDMSLPGATAGDALDGVAMMPFGPFESHIAATRATTLVIRYGGADAIRGVTQADFERNMTKIVTLAQRAGKRVILVGIIDVQESPGNPPELRARLASFDVFLSELATKTGAELVNVRALPVTFPGDLADAVHPAQAWSDRITAAIVQQLKTRPL